MEDPRYVIDISAHWQRDSGGNPRTVNSVFEEIRGTKNHLSPNTLRLARDGSYDRGKFSNAVKLARLCSKWSQRPVTIDQIISKLSD